MKQRLLPVRATATTQLMDEAAAQVFWHLSLRTFQQFGKELDCEADDCVDTSRTTMALLRNSKADTPENDLVAIAARKRNQRSDAADIL